MTFEIVLGISAFLFALLGTRLTILAVRSRQPRGVRLENSKHIAPTPQGGGIAIVFTLVICLMQTEFSYDIIFSMLMLAAVSLLGDLIRISQPVRLMAHAIAVSVPLSTMGVDILGDVLPLWLSKSLLAVAWMWFMHVFRMMDGVDGMTSTEIINIGLGICLIMALVGNFPSPLFTYAMILAATGCGFIWWNWYPAKIFLGEIGSVPIGFLCFYILLQAATSHYLYAALILPAYYVCDGTLTLIKRIYKGKKIWATQSDHYYHRAMRNGRRPDSVARYVFGINLLLTMLATLSALNPESGLINTATAYAVVFILLGFFAHSPHDPRHEPL